MSINRSRTRPVAEGEGSFLGIERQISDDLIEVAAKVLAKNQEPLDSLSGNKQTKELKHDRDEQEKLSYAVRHRKEQHEKPTEPCAPIQYEFSNLLGGLVCHFVLTFWWCRNVGRHSEKGRKLLVVNTLYYSYLVRIALAWVSNMARVYVGTMDSLLQSPARSPCSGFSRA